MKPKFIALAGGIAIIAGSLMPWATVNAGLFSVSKTGTDGDGIITLIIGVLIVLAALIASEAPGARGSTIAGILCLIAGVVAVIDIADVSRLAGEFSNPIASISIGTGLYVVGVGAVIGLVGSFMRNPETDAA